MAAPTRLTKATLAAWLKPCTNYVITDAVSGAAAQVPAILPTAIAWSTHAREWTSAAGWTVISILAMRGGIDEALAADLIARVTADIHVSPNRARYSMNNALIAMGGSIPTMHDRAIMAAISIDLVHVDHGETGCRTPDAVDMIGKMVAHRAARRTRVTGPRATARPRKAAAPKGAKKPRQHARAPPLPGLATSRFSYTRLMVDVVGVGANSVDRVYRLPAFPSPSGPASKLRIAQHAIMPGGQTATTLCTCATMGLTTRYVGATGIDDGGRLIRDELSRRNVDISRCIVRDASNAYAVILIDETQGERVVLWDRDLRLNLAPGEIDAAGVADARLLHVDDVDLKASLHAASIARDARIPITSDIETVGDKTDELIAAVTIPIFAEQVLEPLTGEHDIERALRVLRRRHTGMLCVTLGALGAMLLVRDRLYEEPAFQTTVVDTTGAGDVFRAGFITAFLRGDAPEDILRFANAAAISCSRLGAINGAPSLDETESVLGRR